MSIIFGKPLLTIGGGYYLYRYGSLCLPNSGGWEKGYIYRDRYFQDNNANVIFNSDNVFINTNNSSEEYAIKNEKKIDFALFSHIEIEYSAETSTPDLNPGRISFARWDGDYIAGVLLPVSPGTIYTIKTPYPITAQMIVQCQYGNLTIKSIKLIEK